MLKSFPSLSDGKVVDKLVESTRVNRPYKPSSLVRRDTEKPTRKRKRVSYKENNEDGSDSDSGDKRKRRKSMGDSEYVSADNTAHITRFPVYRPKPFEEVFGGEGRKFAIPSITTKEGRVIRHAISNASLGLKVQPVIPPRP